MAERDPHHRIQQEMVDALASCATLSSETGRELFVDLLSDSLGSRLSLRVQTTARLQIIDIVRTCAKQAGGLAAMVEVAAEFEPKSAETFQLMHLLAEWEAVADLPKEDWPALRATLQGLVVPDLQEACRVATASRVPNLPPHCATPWHVFLYLVGANSAPDMLPPWMVFLDHVAQWTDHETAREMRAPNQQRAAEYGLLTQLEAARWQLVQVRPDAAPTAYLVIQLEPDPVDPDRFTLSYWHQWDPYGWRPERGEDQLVHREQLEPAVADVVGDMEAAWGNRRGSLVVEFVLPWDLLNAPVEWWPKDSASDSPVPLTRDYPVVVRSLDRLAGRPWHRVWHQRWSQLERSPGVSRVHWSQPASENHFARLGEELRADEHIVSLVLSEPPQGEVGRHELKAALRFGLPVVVWHRVDCSTAAFRQAVADLFADGGLAQLPTRARELRLKALSVAPESREQHVGRHLTVLWDDPRRQPRMADGSGRVGGGFG